MNLGALSDALKLITTVEMVKGELADVEDKEVGETTIVNIPEAKRLSALLIRGKGGRRFRITGLVCEREK